MFFQVRSLRPPNHNIINGSFCFADWNSSATAPVWSQGDFWAPDLQLVDGRFACYFSARKGTGSSSRGLLSLGVAFSSSITGPYTDIGQPLLADATNPQGTIDVHYHRVSATGEQYLLWKANNQLSSLSARIMMQQLGANGSSVIGSAWTIATADQGWEEFGCVEAPWLLERNGSFYLFYSGSMVSVQREERQEK
jgi:beta-xylosidase